MWRNFEKKKTWIRNCFDKYTSRRDQLAEESADMQGEGMNRSALLASRRWFAERDVILSHHHSGNEDVLLGWWSRWYRVDQMRRRMRPRRPRGPQRRPSRPDLAPYRGETRLAECTEKLRQCGQREIQARALQGLPEDRETHQLYDPWVTIIPFLRRSESKDRRYNWGVSVFTKENYMYSFYI